MKRYLLFILVCIPMFTAAQITGQLNVNIEDLTFEEYDGYTKIMWRDGYLTESGLPELPVVYKSYVIPANAENVVIQV